MENVAFIKIHHDDNVVVCLRDIAEGETLSVDGHEITVRQDVPVGHKILLEDTSKGKNIIKYGSPIGHLTKDLQAGEWVSEANLHTNLSEKLSYEYKPEASSLIPHPSSLTFNGYLRKSGEVGVRNEIWIVPTVGCVNGIAKRLEDELKQEISRTSHLAPRTSISSVHAWNHNYGCSQLGDDHENTRKILRDIVLHPNTGGVLVLSLGCENNQLSDFKQLLGNYDKERVRFLVCQEVAGNEVEEGMKILRELCTLAAKDERTPQPLSKLRVGLKCGGSDGLSGITANPLVGMFSDWLVCQGGSTVLTEVPEMFGAETQLMSRCKTQELFNQTVALINDFKDYYLSHGQPVGENPSPGNKAGGISTLEEKALGCTQKGGKAPVTGVLAYGERLHTPGLNLLSAPGNDLVAATALAASGCQIVLFTTGRGTPFGTFVPTLKVSTNTKLFESKPHWMDFNAGTLVENVDMDTTLRAFIQKVLAVANGEPTRNEENGYSEIAIFKNGVTL